MINNKLDLKMYFPVVSWLIRGPAKALKVSGFNKIDTSPVNKKIKTYDNLFDKNRNF